MIVSGQQDPYNDLKAWEDRLRAWEANLVTREQELKQKLQAEMERLLVDFEINHYEKIIGLQKRFLVHEKTVKAKIKQLEGKGNPTHERKIVKAESFKPPEMRPGQNNDDKLLLKLVSLEKANDVLKHKNLDLETQLLNLSKRSNSEPETLEEKAIQDENDAGNSPNVTGGKISKKEKVVKIIGDKALTKTAKKKPSKEAISTAGAKSAVSYASELKVSLQLLEKIAYCLRFSVPFASGLQIPKQSSVEGLLFPLSETLLAYLTELIHLVNRPSSSKELQGVFELFYKLLRFTWKDRVKGQNTLFKKFVSDPEINTVINKAKTSKDHVEEIMNSQQYPSLIHKEFTPLTDYWKKLIKSESKKESDLAKSHLQGPPSNTIKLFSNPTIQKEIIRILLLFISTSDLMLLNQAPQSNEAQNDNEQLLVDVKVSLPFDSVKSLLLMRVMASLTILLLSTHNKELNASLSCLKADLFGKTNKISKFLKNYFVVECGGIEILTNVLDVNNEKVLIQLVSEVSALLKE